jgi:protein gp37
MTGTHYPDEAGNNSFGWDGKAHFFLERLEEPFRLRPGKDSPHRIFVCSMSDLFHESLTNEQIAAVFGVMAATPQHQYVVLTKRLQRAKYWFSFVGATADHYGQAESVICMDNMLRLGDTIDTAQADIITQRERWPLPNVVIGASVENQKAADERIPLLLQIPARWRGVSVEPMLGPVELTRWIGPNQYCDHFLKYPSEDDVKSGVIDCSRPENVTGKCSAENCVFGKLFSPIVICGAETGPGKRPFNDEWALDLRDQCKSAGAPFFFKKDGAGKPTLRGVEYHEWIGE